MQELHPSPLLSLGWSELIENKFSRWGKRREAKQARSQEAEQGAREGTEL